MKKTFITLLLAGSGSLLWAQQTGTDSTTGNTGDPVRSNTDSSMQQNTLQQDKDKKWNNKTTGDASTRQSTGSYNAYGAAVPSNVLHSFSKEVPTGSDAQWEQSNEYWRVNYVDNSGKKARRYYSMNGQSFAISLPIMSSFVPDNVMAKVQELYGDKVYDVTMMRGTQANQSGAMMQNGANAAWSNNGTASVNGSASVNAGNTTVNSNASTSMNNNGTTTTTSGTDVSSSTSVNTTTTTVVDPVAGAHYQVRIIENGTVRSEMINEDGSAYVAPVVTDSLGMNQQGGSQQWNNNTQGTMNNNQGSMNTTVDSTNSGSGTTADSTSVNNGQMLNNQSGTTTNNSVNTTTETGTTSGTTTDANGNTTTTNASGSMNSTTGNAANNTGTTVPKKEKSTKTDQKKDW